ncbi:MAG: glycosyltransferase family 9 protein [Planctomycetota bacterium]
MYQANKSDILKALEDAETQAARKAAAGLIIQPGAIGDCILTLPLAEFMKQLLQFGQVHLIGRSEYIDYFPGRTCIDRIRSIDSIAMHRMFLEPPDFVLADSDPLIHVFADYKWIITFLGEPGSTFEQNLIFTAHCSHSAEITTVPLNSPADLSSHISDFYIRLFASQNLINLQSEISINRTFINPSSDDRRCAIELLADLGIRDHENLIIIHPGSGSTQKCWPVQNFSAVADILTSHGCRVLFLLGPAEIDRLNTKSLNSLQQSAPCASGLSLTRVLQLLTCARVFIGNDSGITHLAGAAGIATIALFGPTNAACYKPLGPKITVIQHQTRDFAVLTEQPCRNLCNLVMQLLDN